jgi:hypothetical protein
MAQLGQKPHGFKDLDFLMVLGNTAVVFGAKWTPVASQTVRVCAPQWGSPSWLPVRRLDVLESVSAGKIACPKSIFEESTSLSIRALGLLWWGRLQPVNARLRAYFFTVSHPR